MVVSPLIRSRDIIIYRGGIKQKRTKKLMTKKRTIQKSYLKMINTKCINQATFQIMVKPSDVYS